MNLRELWTADEEKRYWLRNTVRGHKMNPENENQGSKTAPDFSKVVEEWEKGRPKWSPKENKSDNIE